MSKETTVKSGGAVQNLVQGECAQVAWLNSVSVWSFHTGGLSIGVGFRA